jgi:hypothetical protein
MVQTLSQRLMPITVEAEKNSVLERRRTAAFKKIDAIKSDATKAESPSSSGGLFGFFK